MNREVWKLEINTEYVKNFVNSINGQAISIHFNHDNSLYIRFNSDNYKIIVSDNKQKVLEFADFIMNKYGCFSERVIHLIKYFANTIYFAG